MENGTLKEKLRISPSALACWKDCKLKFKLTYLDKVRTPVRGNKYSCFGSAIHKSIDEFYKAGDFNNRDLILDGWPENFLSQLMETGVKLSEKEIEEFEELGTKTLTDFYDRQKEDGLLVTPLLTEKKFTLDFGKFILVGIIDIAFGTPDSVFISDFKTNSKAKSKKELAEDKQLSTYGLLWWKENKVIPTEMNLHFVKLNKKVTTTRTMEQLIEFEKFLLSFYDKVMAETEWPPTTTHCSWCDFKSVCPKSKMGKVRLIV